MHANLNRLVSFFFVVFMQVSYFSNVYAYMIDKQDHQRWRYSIVFSLSKSFLQLAFQHYAWLKIGTWGSGNWYVKHGAVSQSHDIDVFADLCPLYLLTLQSCCQHFIFRHRVL